MIRSLALIFLSVGFSLQCEIIVRNVGQKNFVWFIEYAGNNQYENELQPNDHDNYSCSCLPHDMEIRLPVWRDSYLSDLNIDIFFTRTVSTATTTSTVCTSSNTQ